MKWGRCLGTLLIGELGETHINKLLLHEWHAKEYE